MQYYFDLIDILEDHLRSGRLKEVKDIFESLNLKKIPSKFRLQFSNFARRAGAPSTAVRILSNNIKNDKATVEEMIEYSISLAQLGVLREALKVLVRAESKDECVKSYYVRGRIYMMMWKYDLAIHFLQEYLDSETDLYKILLTKINLISCYLFEAKLENAKTLLEEVFSKLDETSMKRLLANAYELRAQLYFQKEEFDKAKCDLEKAYELLPDKDSRESIYIQKWMVLTNFKLERSSDSLKAIYKLREEARRIEQWEVCRDLDLYFAIETKSKTLLAKVYYGTKHKSYKNRVLKLINENVDENYLWCLGPETNKRDVFKITELASKGLKEGSLLYKLFVLFTLDHYLPLRVGEIHAELYTDQIYNPTTSPAQVYELIRRLRQWMSKNDIPLTIEEESGTYRLSSDHPIAIFLTRDDKLKNPVDHFIGQLEKTFGNERFSAKEACESLKLSRSKFLRLMRQIEETNKSIKVFGQGSKIKYRIS